MIGCSKISGFESAVDQGTLAWHDVYLANKSGKDLHEVNMTLTIVGENGEPRSEKKYFAQWLNGETIKVSFPIGNTHNVQKIMMVGSCKEGRIDYTRPNPPAHLDELVPEYEPRHKS
jgi:hypothetical protein